MTSTLFLKYLMSEWRPTIGNPCFLRLVTTAYYFACAASKFNSGSHQTDGDRRTFLFWSMISLLMIPLVINKQFDLQRLFAELGKG
jgi:hypothetical protein